MVTSRRFRDVKTSDRAQSRDAILNDLLNAASSGSRVDIDRLAATTSSNRLECAVQWTGSDLSPGQVVGIASHQQSLLYTPIDNPQNRFNQQIVKGAAPQTPQRFMIADGFARNGEFIRCVVRGHVWAKIQRTTGNDLITRADIVAGSQTFLTPQPYGAAEILWVNPAMNQTVNCLVDLQGPIEVEMDGVASFADIFPDSSGVVNLVDVNTSGGFYLIAAHLSWMHGGEKISAGKQVRVRWSIFRKRWEIVGAECE